MHESLYASSQCMAMCGKDSSTHVSVCTCMGVGKTNAHTIPSLPIFSIFHQRTHLSREALHTCACACACACVRLSREWSNASMETGEYLRQPAMPSGKEVLGKLRVPNIDTYLPIRIPSSVPAHSTAAVCWVTQPLPRRLERQVTVCCCCCYCYCYYCCCWGHIHATLRAMGCLIDESVC